MNSRTLAVVLAVPAALALAACSSTVAGTPQAAGGSSSPGRGGASTPPASSAPVTGAAPSSSFPSTSTSPGAGTSNNGAQLGTQLAKGLETAKTAHIQLAVGLGSQAILAIGNETLHNGKLGSLQLKENIPGAGDLSLLIVGGKTYVKLPPSLQTGSKPWLVVRANSSNQTVQILAGSLASTKTSASLDSVTAFVTAAKSIKDVGVVTAGGISATHYSIIVSVDNLPDSYPGKSALVSAGLKTIPLQLFVDSSGRPVRVKETLEVQGQEVQTKLNITRYNLPITISAPRKSQISNS
jgi:hypothetical protein